MYHVDLFATVVHVSQQDDLWNFSMKITDWNHSYDDLLGILYDRVPTLPMEIRRDSGSFEDLILNLKKRAVTPFYQKRNYPRVVIDDGIDCEGTFPERVHMYDFNFVCATITDNDAPDELRLRISRNIVIDCKFETEIRKGLRLYNVQNYKEIVDDRKKRDELVDWLVYMSAGYEQRKLRQGRAEFNEMEYL